MVVVGSVSSGNVDGGKAGDGVLQAQRAALCLTHNPYHSRVCHLSRQGRKSGIDCCLRNLIAGRLFAQEEFYLNARFVSEVDSDGGCACFRRTDIGAAFEFLARNVDEFVGGIAGLIAVRHGLGL